MGGDTSRPLAVVVLEEGPGPALPAESASHAFLSASITLTLGILGSSVLPVPFAFSRMGVALSLVTAAVVAAANAYTGTLVVRAAGAAHKHTFESLAHAVCGRGWQIVTQVSLVVLLFGTLCGDYALLADTGKIAVSVLFPDSAPAWLTGGGGRGIMVVLGLLVVFPLSCLHRMRQLERVAMAGVGLVVALAAVILTVAWKAGFPAIRSGELPLASFKLNADLPASVAVLSFSFYLQPMLLPMLREMPIGQLGVDLTARATQIVTCVVAYAVYAVVGVSAAARYGLRTEGDVLVNAWLPGRWDGALDALVALYLSISMAPMAMTLRYQLDSLFFGEDAPHQWRRELWLTALCLLSSLAVALAWPTKAQQIFSVTGASGVCLVCYVIPVVIHLRLFFSGGAAAAARRRRGLHAGSRRARRGGGAAAAAAAPPQDSPRRPQLPECDSFKEFSFGERPADWGSAANFAAAAAGGGAAPAGDGGPAAWLLEAERGAAPPSLPPLDERASSAAAPVPGAKLPAAPTDLSLSTWLPSRISSAGGRAGSSSLLLDETVGASGAAARAAAAEDATALSAPLLGPSPAAARGADPDHGLHARLLGAAQRRRARAAAAAAAERAASPPPAVGLGGLPAEAAYPSARGLRGAGAAARAWGLALHLGLPLAVMLLGCGFSLSALWLAVAPLLR
eukprot:scaffold11.g3836.t1